MSPKLPAHWQIINREELILQYYRVLTGRAILNNSLSSHTAGMFCKLHLGCFLLFQLPYSLSATQDMWVS
ncbi:hypothetical protein XENTR_v10012743 [Xenopus tropicalis]|nr:hypothetical protein XENTR_v10012743 [Xenopus tropicalis]